MKKLSILILLIIAAAYLPAQSDSSFVSIYPFNPDLSSFWDMEHGFEQAVNVLEAWDGSFVLQSSILVDTDPPPGLGLWQYYSPFVVFNRDGQYLWTSQNIDDNCNSLAYRRVIKAEPGYYLGFGNTYYIGMPSITRMDSNFYGIAAVFPTLNNGLSILPRDIIETNGGYIVSGTVSPDTLLYGVVAKFDFTDNEIWHRSFVFSQGMNHLQRLSDGSFLFMIGNKLMRVSAEGDSLAYTELNGFYPSQVLELNNHFYAVCYDNPAVISFWDLGVGLSITNPVFHHSLPVNPMENYSNYQGFLVVNTNDGGYLVLASAPNGEVAKYNSSHICEWTADIVINESVGCGRHNIIQLANGDYLYCTGIGSPYNTCAFALVRITAEGVLVSDLQEAAPSVPYLSISPSPFSEKTSIEVKGNIDYTTVIQVYNLKGQLLESLPITNNQASWKPTNCSSGIYLISVLQNGKRMQTKKVSYLK